MLEAKGWRIAEYRGWQDFESGKDRGENPYQPLSLESSAWLNGWISADLYYSKDQTNAG